MLISKHWAFSRLILDCTTHDTYYRICRPSPHTHLAFGNAIITQTMDTSGGYSPVCLSVGPFWPLATTLTAPQIVLFGISNFSVQPWLRFSFGDPNEQADIIYHLSAVLYFGGAHFTSHYIDASGRSWAYDGQLHGGVMVSEGPATSIDLTPLHAIIADLRRCCFRCFCMYLSSEVSSLDIIYFLLHRARAFNHRCHCRCDECPSPYCLVT